MTTTTAPFRSILFDRPADAAASADRSVLTDLNLDQVFTLVAAGRDEYGLVPSFSTRQVIRPLAEAGIRIVFVTHMYDLAGRYYAEHDPGTLFLRAERRPDGQRTFRLLPGEPLPTSYGEDLYHEVFGAADQRAQA